MFRGSEIQTGSVVWIQAYTERLPQRLAVATVPRGVLGAAGGDGGHGGKVALVNSCFIISPSSASSWFVNASRVACQILFDKQRSMLKKKVCKPQVQRTDF